ncbi:MAG: hypothetical protein ACP5NF_11700, partial [Thermoanaerobaculum sp.]
MALLRQVEVVNWQIKLRRESQWLGLYGTRGIDSENFPEEVVRVRRQLRILRKNLATYAPGKRVAFLVWDGLEVNPLATGSAHGSQERDPIPTSWRFSNLEEMRGIAELCESLGVPLISLFPGFMGSYSPTWSATFRRPAVSSEVFGRSATVADSELLTVDPQEPMVLLADRTGGTVVSPRDDVAAGLTRIANSYLLWLQLPASVGPGVHALQVEARDPSIKIWAPRRLAVGTPREGAAQTAVRSLSTEGALAEGDLPLEVALAIKDERGKVREGGLKVRADFGQKTDLLESFRMAKLRLTLAVRMTKGEPFVHQEEFVQEVKEGAGTV